jgi:predicted metalloprotease with PDZ domain
MLWLAVDAELRDRSGGRYGIDEFARRFFAVSSADAPTRAYTFDDVCSTLAAIAPRDWRAFLHGWIDAHDELDTTTGLVRHGWRLVYTDVPTATFRASEDEDGVANLSYSIGLMTTDQGLVRSVAWNGPAFRAGMRPGVRIMAVNMAPFTRDALLSAVNNTVTRPLVLTVEQDGQRSDRSIAYKGKLRYPRLERIDNQADTLTALIAPR